MRWKFILSGAVLAGFALASSTHTTRHSRIDSRFEARGIAAPTARRGTPGGYSAPGPSRAPGYAT
jgi:hypothetical protein